MSHVTYMAPVDEVRGKLCMNRGNDSVIVTRRKCYGRDAKGRPIYGPAETYIYHRHEGKWSEAATKNRELFQQVQLLAKEELSNPGRVTYWQPLFEQQFLHPKQGEKHYATLRGFVIAQLHQQIKNAE